MKINNKKRVNKKKLVNIIQKFENDARKRTMHTKM